MREHDLKTLPQYFRPVKAGVKRFEVRVDDRGFEPGDILNLVEWDPDAGFTGDSCRVRVTYLMQLPELAPRCHAKSVVMSIERAVA